MFSRTVSPGKIRRPSGTWLMPSRAMASGPARWIGFPSKYTSPSVGASSPEIVFSVELLPAPLAPSSVTSSPASTCRLTPFSAWTLP